MSAMETTMESTAVMVGPSTAALPPAIPPPSDLVKTLSNVSTTSTVTIDSAFSDSSTSPQSVSSKERPLPPKSPHSLPPLPSFNGRTRSVSTEFIRKKSGLDSYQSFGLRKKGSRTKRSNSTIESEQASMDRSIQTISATSEVDRLLRKLRKTIKRFGEKDAAVGAIYTALGNLHFRESRMNEAISSYKVAIDCCHGPHSATACLNLGTAYWNQLDVTQATKYMTKAMKALQQDCLQRGASPELCPEVASCHHQLGLVYALGNQYEAAVNEIEIACRMRLAMYGSAHPMTARTLDAAGRIHSLRGEFDQALHCHEQALTVLHGTPYATATLENIAMAHAGRGDFLAAVHIFVDIVTFMKTMWHREMAKPYYERNQSAAQQLSSYLLKLGNAYKKVHHHAYANQCIDEADFVLVESGLQPPDDNQK